jgi:hypothetical protein
VNHAGSGLRLELNAATEAKVRSTTNFHRRASAAAECTFGN